MWLKKCETTLLAAPCVELLGANLSHHVFPEQTVKLLYECWSEGQPGELSLRRWAVFPDVLQDTGVKSPDCCCTFAASGSFYPGRLQGLRWAS